MMPDSIKYSICNNRPRPYLRIQYCDTA